MSKNKELIERIGIDKTVITNFTIKSIDTDYLKAMNIEIIENNNSLLKTEDNIGILKLKIKDSFFGMLDCGFTNANKNKKFVSYTKLTITVSQNYNLQNLNVEEYKQRIKDVFQYINEKYKIEITYSFDTLNITYMEINYTFKLKYKFNDYKRALLILISNMPKNKYSDKSNHNIKYKSFFEINQDENIANLETLSVKNSSIEFVIYNKTKQIKDTKNISLPDDYIRIEYRLKRKDSYIKSIGGVVSNLTDKKLKDFYIKNFTYDIIKPFDSYKEKIKEQFEKELKPFLEKSDKQWYSKFIRIVKDYEINNNFPMLVDITDIFPMLKQYSKTNYSRRIKMVINKANKYDKSLLDVNKKINEILNKIKSINE